MLDEDDNVIRPAILWNDGRTAKQVDYLNNIIGKDKLSALTANIAFAGFTAPKLLRMKEHELENFAMNMMMRLMTVSYTNNEDVHSGIKKYLNSFAYGYIIQSNKYRGAGVSWLRGSNQTSTL